MTFGELERNLKECRKLSSGVPHLPLHWETVKELEQAMRRARLLEEAAEILVHHDRIESQRDGVDLCREAQRLADLLTSPGKIVEGKEGV